MVMTGFFMGDILSARPADQSKSLQAQGLSARHYNPAQLAAALRGSRAQLKALVSDLSDAQWLPPQMPGVNPLAWELAHIAWFTEWWTLRGPHRVDDAGRTCAARASQVDLDDALFDSSRLAHADRWRIALPSRAQVFAWLDAQLELTLAALAQAESSDAALYFYRLALFHEDMHCEALIWLRATLALPAPAGVALPHWSASTGQMECPAAQSSIGAEPAAGGFVFDNEQWAQLVELPAFTIDAAPVGNAQFAVFVEAGGYDNPAFWPGPAGQWRAAQQRNHPQRWRKGENGWQHRWFDQWLPLAADAPVMHVNAFEAEAFCLWSHRALPSEAQWEHAAGHAGIQWGASVWEWTRDAFLPYAGFAAGPYREYSGPWFGNHRALRGGAFATHPRMHHPQYRNFFTPDRCDVFAGFRTVSR